MTATGQPRFRRFSTDVGSRADGDPPYKKSEVLFEHYRLQYRRATVPFFSPPMARSSPGNVNGCLRGLAVAQEAKTLACNNKIARSSPTNGHRRAVL